MLVVALSDAIRVGLRVNLHLVWRHHVLVGKLLAITLLLAPNEYSNRANVGVVDFIS